MNDCYCQRYGDKKEENIQRVRERVGVACIERGSASAAFFSKKVDFFFQVYLLVLEFVRVGWVLRVTLYGVVICK